MPPARPKPGLLPSLLDRLTDPDAAGTAGAPGYTVEKMYAAVLRDLEDLLNTLHTAHDIPAAFPETRASIVGYGLPDLTSVEAISPDQRAAIGRAIRTAVERFEPRLRAVRVVPVRPEEDPARRSIRFRVEARLATEPAPDVAFDAILETGSGTYLVTPAAE